MKDEQIHIDGFMRVLGYLIVILGLIVTFVLAVAPDPMSGDNHLNIRLWLGMYAPTFLSGILIIGFADLIKYNRIIASLLKQVIEVEVKEKTS